MKRPHLAEAAIDGALLAVFMLVACALAVVIDHPAGALHLDDPLARRALFGAGMGLTAIALVYSRWGKRSGAHLNPAVTLTFLRLGRVPRADAIGYVVAQLAGAALGVLAAWAAFGARLAHETTRFVVTRPGGAGPVAAFAAEVAISAILMAVVLAVSGSRRASLTGVCAGVLVFLLITLEAPLSGMSMNPARSFGSAIVAGDLGALWIYFTAPPLGMLLAAALLAGRATGCAKLCHPDDVRCIFCGRGEDREREPLLPRLFRSDRNVPDALLSGAALGLRGWLAFSVVLLPAAAGEAPRWTAAGMRTLLPQLVGWTLAGAAAGALLRALGRAAERRRAARPPVPAAARPPPRRVLILGGGFAGVACARELERLAGADPSLAATLVSETNALLFTPMLAEVAGSSIEPTHISAPIRTALRRTDVVRARVERLDLDARRVELESGATLPYDQLVLALGAVSNHSGNPALERHAIGFRSLREAIRIRDGVIEAFERAGREPDPARRREGLTFVVAGGGFAGVELAGALNDFARGILADYPALGPDDVRVALVHAGDRILPELSEPLGRYAQRRMAARGVEFLLGAHVKDARAGMVVLDSGEELRAGCWSGPPARVRTRCSRPCRSRATAAARSSWTPRWRCRIVPACGRAATARPSWTLDRRPLPADRPVRAARRATARAQRACGAARPRAAAVPVRLARRAVRRGAPDRLRRAHDPVRAPSQRPLPRAPRLAPVARDLPREAPRARAQGARRLRLARRALLPARHRADARRRRAAGRRVFAHRAGGTPAGRGAGRRDGARAPRGGGACVVIGSRWCSRLPPARGSCGGSPGRSCCGSRRQ
jgi:MIP family channel proteins